MKPPKTLHRKRLFSSKSLTKPSGTLYFLPGTPTCKAFKGLGFRVQGSKVLGLRVWGVGFIRTWGSEYRVKDRLCDHSFVHVCMYVCMYVCR